MRRIWQMLTGAGSSGLRAASGIWTFLGVRAPRYLPPDATAPYGAHINCFGKLTDSHIIDNRQEVDCSIPLGGRGFVARDQLQPGRRMKCTHQQVHHDHSVQR